MTVVTNLRRRRYDVYIGRAGKGQSGLFGNPFTIQEHGARALQMFADYFLRRVAQEPQFRDEVLKLRGKTLGCFCKPGPCHGDLIAYWLDNQELEPREIQEWAFIWAVRGGNAMMDRQRR